MMLWIGTQVSNEMLLELFGVATLDQINITMVNQAKNKLT